MEADVWLFDEELYVEAQHGLANTKSNLHIPLHRSSRQDSRATKSRYGFLQRHLSRRLRYRSRETPNPARGRQNRRARNVALGLSINSNHFENAAGLTYVENNEVHFRPITVVGTGNTPFDVLMQNSTYRDTFFDAPLDQMWEPRQRNQEMKDWPDSEFDDSLPGEGLDEDEGSARRVQSHTSRQRRPGTVRRATYRRIQRAKFLLRICILRQ